jgi:hypothetical protein
LDTRGYGPQVGCFSHPIGTYLNSKLVDFKLVIRKTFTVKGRSEDAKGFVEEEFW